MCSLHVGIVIFPSNINMCSMEKLKRNLLNVGSQLDINSSYVSKGNLNDGELTRHSQPLWVGRNGNYSFSFFLISTHVLRILITGHHRISLIDWNIVNIGSRVIPCNDFIPDNSELSSLSVLTCSITNMKLEAQ